MPNPLRCTGRRPVGLGRFCLARNDGCACATFFTCALQLAVCAATACSLLGLIQSFKRSRSSKLAIPESVHRLPPKLVTPESVHALHLVKELNVGCKLHLRPLVGLTRLACHQIQPRRPAQYVPDVATRRILFNCQTSCYLFSKQMQHMSAQLNSMGHFLPG